MLIFLNYCHFEFGCFWKIFVLIQSFFGWSFWHWHWHCITFAQYGSFCCFFRIVRNWDRIYMVILMKCLMKTRGMEYMYVLSMIHKSTHVFVTIILRSTHVCDDHVLTTNNGTEKLEQGSENSIS